MDQIHNILIILSGIVIMSHLIVMVSHAIRLPSVILFVTLGIALQKFFASFNINPSLFYQSLIFFGILGLILIVFEGSLDLKIERNKLRLLGSASGAAVFVFLLTTVYLTLYFCRVYECDLKLAVINAMPFSIISSAIAISSSHHFSDDRKEFIIYESILSDILGILVFSFFLTPQPFEMNTVLTFFSRTLIVIVVSLAASYVLFLLFLRTRIKTKSMFILAILILGYSVGKIFHLPALILVLFFGLFITNYLVFNPSAFRNSGLRGEVYREIKQFKSTVSEVVFLIRSYFFILLGFSIKLNNLTNYEVLICGAGISAIILLARYLYFRLFLKSRIPGEFFIAPRGLVTILLFYSIPHEYRLRIVNESVLVVVIIVTNLLMIFGTRGECDIPESDSPDG